MNAGRTIYRKYASLSGPEFLEETDSLSFTVHQLLIAPQRGLQLHSRSPIHAGIFWLDLVQACVCSHNCCRFTCAMACRVQQIMFHCRHSLPVFYNLNCPWPVKVLEPLWVDHDLDGFIFPLLSPGSFLPRHPSAGIAGVCHHTWCAPWSGSNLGSHACQPSTLSAEPHHQCTVPIAPLLY